MDLSIIIVSYNSLNDIVRNLDSIRKHFTGFTYEVIIVNNFASDIEIHNLPIQYDFVTLIDDGINYGFGVANNIGMKNAKGKYICFLNPDVILLSNILPLMHKLDSDASIGLIAPLLRYQDLSLQKSCYQFPGPRNWLAYNLFLNRFFPNVRWWGNFPMFYFNYKGDYEAEWVSGAFMLLPRMAAEAVKGFDPDFFMYCEDIELCWQIHALGYKIMFSDASEAIHIGGTSAASKSKWQAEQMAKSYIILWSKHYDYKIIRKLAYQTRMGALLRRAYWRIACRLKLSTKTDEVVFNKTLADEIIKRLYEYENKPE